MLVFNTSSLADSNGDFPNKGDYSNWKQAVDASEDGVIYAKKGNYTMALQCYDEAIQLYPYDATFYFNKGIALHKKAKFVEAIEQFKKSLELEPSFASAWYNMGNSQKDANQLDDALRSYNESLRLRPDEFKAEFNSAECSFVKKDLDAALQMFTRSLPHSKDPKDQKDCTDYIARIKKMIERNKAAKTNP